MKTTGFFNSLLGNQETEFSANPAFQQAHGTSAFKHPEAYRFSRAWILVFPRPVFPSFSSIFVTLCGWTEFFAIRMRVERGSLASMSRCWAAKTKICTLADEKSSRENSRPRHERAGRFLSP